jgi:hypothetical protein
MQPTKRQRIDANATLLLCLTPLSSRLDLNTILILREISTDFTRIVPNLLQNCKLSVVSAYNLVATGLLRREQLSLTTKTFVGKIQKAFSGLPSSEDVEEFLIDCLYADCFAADFVRFLRKGYSHECIGGNILLGFPTCDGAKLSILSAEAPIPVRCSDESALLKHRTTQDWCSTSWSDPACAPPLWAMRHIFYNRVIPELFTTYSRALIEARSLVFEDKHLGIGLELLEPKKRDALEWGARDCSQVRTCKNPSLIDCYLQKLTFTAENAVKWLRFLANYKHTLKSLHSRLFDIIGAAFTDGVFWLNVGAGRTCLKKITDKNAIDFCSERPESAFLKHVLAKPRVKQAKVLSYQGVFMEVKNSAALAELKRFWGLKNSA